MDAKDFALDLRRQIDELNKNGVDSIATESLISYLDGFIRDSESTSSTPSIVDVELYKARLQTWVEEHKNNHVQSVELFKSVIQAGQNALKTAFLMNGGATVSLLAFIGHLSSAKPEKVPLLATSLTIFVCGVLVSAVTTGTTYLSQWFYAADSEWKRKTGFALNIISISMGLASYIVFAFGIHASYQFFSGFTA